MKEILIKDKIFKQFKNTQYFCDENGNIYSNFSQKILKPLKRKTGNKTYLYIDINFGEGQKHIPIHRIVYECWVGPLKKEQQVNHKDDNSFNNNYKNLYTGSQQDNIQDCINNKHRVGNTWVLTVYDNIKKETITFCPASNFINYCGHPCANGGLNRMFTRNWFKKQYSIISYYHCKNISIKEGVTTMADECKPVE